MKGSGRNGMVASSGSTEFGYTAENTGCPYLGVHDDPTTRFSYVSSGNCCHRSSFVLPVGLDHQSAYCLSDNFSRCSIYKTPPTNTEALLRLSLYPPWHDDTHTGMVRQNPGRASLSIAPSVLKVLAVVLLVVVTFALIAGVSAMYLNNEQGKIALLQATQTVEAEQQLVFLEQTRDAAKAINATSTAVEQNRQAELAATETAAAFIVVVPTHTPMPTTGPTQAPVNTPTPDPTPIPDCASSSPYLVDLLSGPNITPDLGYIYDYRSQPPIAEVAWTIKNTGGCGWNQVVLLTQGLGRRIAPSFRKDGLLFQPQAGQSFAEPGDTLMVLLYFNPKFASDIRGEWILEINGFTLADQPHLTLDVKNWITYIPPILETQPVPNNPPEPPRPEPPTATPPSARPTDPPTARP